ncbi:MAG: aminoglycoside phosphotransferase, partial [Pseudoxanthomonas sp.]
SWPLARVDGWLALYHQRAQAAGLPVPALARFQRDADWLGVQRHLKILGVFARLHYRDGKSKYLQDAPRFIAYLEEMLPRYPQLQSLAGLLESRIKPALQSKVVA